MKKYAEMKRVENEELEVQAEEQTALVEKPGFKVRVKETASNVVHNKWVRRVGTGVALAAVGVAGFMLGDKFGSHGADDDEDFEIIDLDAEIDEVPADE